MQAKPRARRRTSCRAPAGSRLVHASHLFSLLSPKAAEDATVIIEHTSARRAESIAAIGSPPTLLNEDNPRLRKRMSSPMSSATALTRATLATGSTRCTKTDCVNRRQLAAHPPWLFPSAARNPLRTASLSRATRTTRCRRLGPPTDAAWAA